MQLSKRMLFCALLLLQQGFVYGKVMPNSLFSDGMVLQQGKSLPVFGTADEGEEVTVRFNGQSVSARAVTGKWLVRLAPMAYSINPLGMTISSKQNTVNISNILIGEVWLCSGQSNMERQLGPRPPQPLVTDWEKERDAANYPAIREYYVPLNYSALKIADVNSRWTVCSPQTVTDFSAVGYFFAKYLHNKIKMPIGIVFSAFGGTPAEDWTSEEALLAEPALNGFVSNYKKIVSAGYQPAGELIGGLYNGMIYPLLPFAIRGVAWYQGEANNNRTEQYPLVLQTMIANWRKDFQQGNFPFLIVQVAPHKDMRPELREAQLIATQKIKNTALIVTTDCGEANDIHPPHKQPVGERLALAAGTLAYGEKQEYAGPVYQSYKKKNNKIELTFTHTGKGLSTKNNEELKGFTIAGEDKKFVPATAIITKKKIVVYSNEINAPVAVRYGWANVPDVNLYNSHGLPASPFRTDHL